MGEFRVRHPPGAAEYYRIRVVVSVIRLSILGYDNDLFTWSSWSTDFKDSSIRATILSPHRRHADMFLMISWSTQFWRHRKCLWISHHVNSCLWLQEKSEEAEPGTAYPMSLVSRIADIMLTGWKTLPSQSILKCCHLTAVVLGSIPTTAGPCKIPHIILNI